MPFKEIGLYTSSPCLRLGEKKLPATAGSSAQVSNRARLHCLAEVCFYIRRRGCWWLGLVQALHPTV